MRTSHLAIVAAFWGAGCGHTDVSREVGARCTNAGDCDQLCLTGTDWPGGFCSVGCAGDLDCPEDTVCIKQNGGVCAFQCFDNADCGFLEPAYHCKEVDHQAGGKVGVCRAD